MWIVCVMSLFFTVAPLLECSASPLADAEGSAAPETLPGLSRDLRRFLIMRELEPQDVEDCNKSSSSESDDVSSSEESSSSNEELSSGGESSSEESTCDPMDDKCRIKLSEDPGFKFFYVL